MNASRPTSSSKSQILAWQGWRLWVPDSWNPVKVDGDWEQGMVLLADMQQPKLGVRWRKAKGNSPEKWADQAMRSEVGQLAAAEAKDWSMSDPESWKASRLYVEPQPPGRDVWLGWSRHSDRVLELVHHAKERDTVLSEQILLHLDEQKVEVKQDWSIFDISCRTPAGWKLQWYRLNAGDLTLSFHQGRKSARIRQIAPAELALKRQTLPKWMQQQDKNARKMYRPMTEPAESSLDLGGRTLKVRRAALRRRRRLFWAFLIPAEQCVIGWHDEKRNRLIIAQGEEESVLKEMLGSCGWAKVM